MSLSPGIKLCQQGKRPNHCNIMSVLISDLCHLFSYQFVPDIRVPPADIPTLRHLTNSVKSVKKPNQTTCTRKTANRQDTPNMPTTV